MAIVNCPECGRRVSDQASACPDCAYPLQKRKPSFVRQLIDPPAAASQKTGRSGPELAFAPFCPMPGQGTPLSEILGNESYSFKDTRLDQRGLRHAGKTWALSRVHVIAIQFTNMDYRANGIVSMGTALQGSFAATVDDGNSISFKASGPLHAWTIGRADRKNQPAFALAHALGRATFEVRAHKYLRQLEEKGYFAYDSAAFYRDGTVVKWEREANLLRDEIKKYTNRYQLDIVVPKSKLAGVLNKVYCQDIMIRTYVDCDVFFTLLAKLYGLRWK